MPAHEEIKIKKRRITSKDYTRVENHILEELKSREGSTDRKDHEKIWKNIDKQIAMVAPETSSRSGKSDDDWHSAIQMGTLSDALEIIAADVMRLAFPLDRKWFRPHVELEYELDENGDILFDQKLQQRADGVLRSLMAQQHADFGHRDRMKAGVKEALIHGGFAAEVRVETLSKYGKGGKVQTIKAPVIVPHSMWNVFPDPSPSIMGTDLFYRGTMIFRSYMPRVKFDRAKYYMRKDKVPEEESTPGKDAIKDVELVTYYGDITLERSNGDMYLPNMKIVLANKILVYIKHYRKQIN